MVKKRNRTISGGNKLHGSIMDPFTRFVLLDPEEMRWFDHWYEQQFRREYEVEAIVAKDIPATPENVAMAERIGQKLPIRKRWRREDRFGNRWYTRKDKATHFHLMCRFNETTQKT